MLWIKTLHVLCVMGWMVGPFYLPRLMVNYAEARQAGEATTRLVDMSRRLFRFSSILAVFGIGFGLVLWTVYGVDGGWLHWKLALVMLLIGYHVACGFMVRRMMAGALEITPVRLRVFNEISVLIAFGILALAIVKPV